MSCLQDLGTTCVLNVTSQLSGYHENCAITYKQIPASDSGQQNLKQYFDEAFEFIGKYRTNIIIVIIQNVTIFIAKLKYVHAAIGLCNNVPIMNSVSIRRKMKLYLLKFVKEPSESRWTTKLYSLSATLYSTFVPRKNVNLREEARIAIRND